MTSGQTKKKRRRRSAKNLSMNMEIVTKNWFSSASIDQHKIEMLLDDCLLTDEEYDSGPASWVDFEDPLPPIELEVDEEDATEVRQ